VIVSSYEAFQKLDRIEIEPSHDRQ
jgi:hypothetical protein